MKTADSDPRTEETSKLLHIPLVLVRVILEELYQDDHKAFMNFRLVSRTCRRESEFLLFRSVALHDTNGVAKSIGLELMERFTNDDDVIREYVRHLRIGPFADEGWFYFEVSPALEGIIRGVKNLQSLTWHTHRSTGPNILQAFHETHPAARLDVVYHHRMYTQINRALLSSPQLHTLDISVYYDRYNVSSGHHELQILKKCLMQGNSIKVLRPKTDSAALPYKYDNHDPRHGFSNWGGITQGPFHFHWQKGESFPALEELKLEYTRYHLTLENCNMWVRCMDWSKLRKLDLNKGAPRHLFLAITNRVPNLKHLRFGIWAYVESRRTTWDLHPLNTGLPVLSKFLASITALQELNFITFDYDDFMSALPVILECQKYKLRRLHIRCSAWQMKAWKPQQFVEMLGMAPGLEFLKAHIKNDILEGGWVGDRRGFGPWQKYESAAKREIPEPEGGGTLDVRGM